MVAFSSNPMLQHRINRIDILGFSLDTYNAPIYVAFRRTETVVRPLQVLTANITLLPLVGENTNRTD